MVSRNHGYSTLRSHPLAIEQVVGKTGDILRGIIGTKKIQQTKKEKALKTRSRYTNAKKDIPITLKHYNRNTALKSYADAVTTKKPELSNSFPIRQQ
jgi:hypothetical protein